MRTLRPIAFSLLALTMLGAAACSDADPFGDNNDATTTANTSVPASLTTEPTRGSERESRNDGDELSTAELVEMVEPSIVRISTGTGIGSGFVVGEDGYIMTNNHVIEGAFGGFGGGRITVTMSDGAQYPAEIVGTDPRADLALLKIEADDLPALEFADLDDVVIGQDVVAMGFALDLDGGEGGSFSVTRGIVSQKNRSIHENSPASILGAIQTDAAINHGNSGGPLLNLYGEVVGINTAIAPDPQTGAQAPGIGFAVGSDTAEAVYEKLRENGQVNRGLLGISQFAAVRPAVARDLGIPEDEGGVLVNNVAVDGPVAAAGMRTGDVIVRIGDHDVKNEADLAVALIRHSAGETVDVEVYRDGEKLTLSVTLGIAPTT